MTDSQYISVRETAQILCITEKKVMDLIEEEKLHAYKIANQFLRLKKDEVNELKNTGKVTTELVIYPYSLGERIRDFFYFNDFYIVCLGIITVLIVIVFQK